MAVLDSDYRERLASEAARVRDSGDLGRSDPLIRLFDFLLERSLADRVPKEVEIAMEVFDKKTDFDAMFDASVRVYIHRLRRKLSEHYGRNPEITDRISLPLGEYRLVLASPPTAEELATDPDILAADRFSRGVRRFWPAVLALLLINGIGWYYYDRPSSSEAAVVQSSLWKPLFDNQRPTLFVMGDYYIFGEAPDGVVVSRLVRDFAINSREDLDQYLLLNPDKVGRDINVNLHYLPVGTGRAMRSLLPVVNAALAPSGQRPAVEGMSDVKPEIFKEANVVYVGFLSGLGPLQDPLFRASGFKVGDSFDELVDKASGRRFKSDWGVVADGKVPQRDYGYIASLLGPTGNRILIIAGTRDPAVAQMAEVAASRAQLAAIDAKSGGQPFEALFEVRTLGNLNIASSLVLVRPVRAESIWQPDR